ncbi:hypothetical protein DDZ13_05810 [Coraliomargarita sinensis]|uniref:Uncharacterized protein n=1 Tax=Coraliomargarita sinensis TaxID=2174842 RepID=A0A317ZGJ4_9BACT|nr:hypothetical protein [Coraliomargarita sinensis]PXA04686.1 hypothetical protein DDZ13_05810 [Coraliomargarita sinensis]
MKHPLFALIFLLPVIASADALKVSTQVLQRADDGSAIRGQFVYPSVELESGETGSMHIGRKVRYPVWVEKVDLGNGVSKDETRYEESPIGLLFSIKFKLKEGVITYSGKAMSKVSEGTYGTSSTLKSSEVIFYGKTKLAELVQVQFEGADGTPEEILIHFGPTEE